MPLRLVLLVIACALSSAALVLHVGRQRLATRFREVKRQAATLAEQAELLDLAHDGILVWDLQSGAIRFWNRGAEELYGWNKVDVLGRTPPAILQTRFPQPTGGDQR